MKKSLFIPAALIALCSFYGCEKSAIPKDEVVVEDEVLLSGDPTILEGNWELRESYGGMRPGNPNHAPGNGNILKFTKNRMERHFDGKLYDSGNFTVRDSVKRINNTSSTHYIEYSSNNDAKYFIRMDGDKLVQFIGQIAADGVELTYVKF